jgi:hypothetical protein
MADVYPAAAQRQALLALMPSLGCSDMTLRRDECGDPRISGKQGCVYGTIAEPKKPGFMIYVTCGTGTGWTYAKRALSFAKLANDGDDEGSFLLDRMPTKSEAETIRRYCGILKKRDLSEESLAQLRERVKRMAETRRAA